MYIEQLFRALYSVQLLRVIKMFMFLVPLQDLLLYLLQLVQALKYEDFEEIMTFNDSIADRKDSISDTSASDKTRYSVIILWIFCCYYFFLYISHNSGMRMGFPWPVIVFGNEIFVLKEMNVNIHVHVNDDFNITNVFVAYYFMQDY